MNDENKDAMHVLKGIEIAFNAQQSALENQMQDWIDALEEKEGVFRGIRTSSKRRYGMIYQVLLDYCQGIPGLLIQQEGKSYNYSTYRKK